jgi:hypothetical protein
LPRSARVVVSAWEEDTALYKPFATRANYWLQDSIHYNSQDRLLEDLARIGATHLVFKPMDEAWCSRSLVCTGRQETEGKAMNKLAGTHGRKITEIGGFALYELQYPSEMQSPVTRVNRSSIE